MTERVVQPLEAERSTVRDERSTAPMVWLRDVERSFVGPGRRAIPVVRIAELCVARGAGLLVLGSNGSGKTTLLHLLAGLLRIDRGSLLVAGRDLASSSEADRDRWRARTVGYLLQGSALLDGLTAEENVMVPMLLLGQRAGQQRRRAAELLSRFDVAHRARHRPAEMSGGERQRVALARSLANDPPLLLADEPTASLDCAGASRLVECLADLRGREGRTLVIATHQPELFDASYERLELRSAAEGASKGGVP
jgi:putative ABC transport system ATP-binding protein